MAGIRKELALLLLGVILLSCLPVKEESDSSKNFKIGAILSLTGDISDVGNAMLEGITLAVDKINARGGIKGRKIELIVESYNYQNLGREATSAAKKLIEEDNVKVSLSHVVNDALYNGPLFEKARIPQIVLWDSNKQIEQIGNYTFSIGFATEIAGQSMADYAFNKLGLKTVAIIYAADDWSILISRSFLERFQSLGGKILSDQQVLFDEDDFRTPLLKAKDAEGIYVPIVINLDLFFKQARENRFNGVIMSGDVLTQQVINNAKGHAEGVYFTMPVAPESDQMRTLEAEYKARYQKGSDLMIFTALGYDAINLVAEAFERASSDDSQDIANQLYSIKNFPGIGGNISINEEGVAPKTEKVFVVKGAKQSVP